MEKLTSLITILDLAVCEQSGVLKTFKILGIVIFVIRIFVPIIIIITSILTFSKTIFDDGEVKDAINLLLKKIFVGLTIAFIPSFFDVAFSLVNGYSDTKSKFINCTKCFVNAPGEDCKNFINIALSRENALAAAEKAKKQKQEESARGTGFGNTDTTNNSTIGSSANTSGVKTDIPYYSQCDASYRRITMPNYQTYDLCSCGCGYTSLAMVIDGLTGNNYTPKGIVQYYNPLTYAAKVKDDTSKRCAINDSTLIDSGIKTTYGVNYNLLFDRNRTASEAETALYKNKIINSLKQNHKVILLIPGHYIVLANIDNINKITLLDPANSNNNKNYTIDEIYNKFKDYNQRCSKPEPGYPKACGFVMAIEYWK